MAKAQEAVRALSAAMKGDIVVNLREGTYTLDRALSFGPEDSGRNGFFVTYRSYPGEKAVISGGQTIRGWEPHNEARTVYQAYVGHDLQTRQLFVDGIRAVRARSESGLTNPVKTASGYTSDDPALAGFRNVEDLEFVFEDVWTNSRAGVQSITADGGKAQITLDPEAWTAISNRGQTSATIPVYYENAYELLDQPGEWYYDRTAGMLYYMPRAWENLSTASVVAPVLERLMDIQGASVDEPVRNLQFEGLEFTYTTWMRPSTPAGHSDAQNNHLRYPGTRDTLPDAAIMLQLANTVNFERNTFTKLGITGIRMDNGVQNSLIEGNHFYDISGGAVTVGQPYSSDPEVYHPADPRKIMKNNDVTNNLIHDIGADYKSASAISAGFPVDMDIRHNEVFSIPYSGTHIGYGWDAKFDPVTRNVHIEDNLIYDLLGKGLRDGGAVYSLGTTGASVQDPNVVSGNYIRNQMNDSAVLYADQGSAFWKYERNVIDLKNTPPWHGAQRWAQVWLPTIHDQFFNGNYTTQPYYVNNGTNAIFENTHVVPDANWPEEALAVIRNSGLQTPFRDVADGIIPRLSADPVNLKSGSAETISIHSRGGKDETLDLGASRVYYASRQPEIAAVDGQGRVTGISRGSTKVDISILNGTMLRTVTVDVYVDDELSEVRLEGEATHVRYGAPGEERELKAVGHTLFGNEVPLDRTEFLSSSPEVATVTEDGRLTAHQAGTAVLTIKGDYAHTSASGYYLYKVVDSATADNYKLRSEIDREDSWGINGTESGSIRAGAGSLTLATAGGYAVQKDRMFLNEMLDFNMTINGSGSWYALSLGNPSSEVNYSNGNTYLVVVSGSSIELHRFNSGKRTVIYGNLAGYPSIGGDAIPNTMLPFGETRRVQVGTFRQDNGVRLVMKVDGKDVFDFVDTDKANALSEPGYFGLIARTGSITLSRMDDRAPAAAGLSLDGLSGIKAGETRTAVVTAVYEDGTNGTLSSGVTFESSDSKIAEVNGKGEVTAHLPGTAVLTARYGEAKGSYSLTVPDSFAPVTTAELTPADPDGANGWYVHPVTLRLGASDEGSGVADTVYSSDGGATWLRYTRALTVEAGGAYDWRFRSTDRSGNEEEVRTLAIKLDTAGPAIEASGVGPDAVYADSTDLALGLHVTDSVSGVEPGKTSVLLDGKPYAPDSRIPLYLLELGSHTLTITAEDRAGNRSMLTIRFQTEASQASLQELVNRFADDQAIDNAGIKKSLLGKLEQKDWQGFRKEVQAQSGKHITKEAADYLSRDALALLNG
ncbi:Ig-like domain-containing protein [Paenibacillus sp. CC-CFT747]|nr:Ig-like domain-containing protein [Paenibacillus sp. CC-CFT747]